MIDWKKMKRILFFLISFYFLLFYLVLIFYKPETVSAQQYSCSKRNPECPEAQYPLCEEGVGSCGGSACIVSMYLKEGIWVMDCAYTTSINPTPTPIPEDECPVCPENYHYHIPYKTCCKNNETPECKTSTPPTYVNCLNTGKNCVPGCGCGQESCTTEERGIQPTECTGPHGEGIETALGCIPTEDTTQFVGWLLGAAIKIAGGIAFLLIIFGAIKVLTSSGNPEAVKAGQEMITSALMGLIFIIFSLFLLELIGVKILNIPGFGINEWSGGGGGGGGGGFK